MVHYTDRAVIRVSSDWQLANARLLAVVGRIFFAIAMRISCTGLLFPVAKMVARADH